MSNLEKARPIEELFKELEAKRLREEENKKSVFGIFWKMYYSLRNTYNWLSVGGPMDIIRNIKYWIQTKIRGWSDRDAWSVYGVMSKIGIIAMDRMMKNMYSHPGNITSKEWKKILKKIRKAFQYSYDISCGIKESYCESIKNTFKRNKDLDMHMITKREQKEMEEGLDLFRKWFFYLDD